MTEQALAAVEGGEATTYQLTPQQQIDKGAEMAKLLSQVVNQADLAKSFGGKKKHLEYEAWQTIGQFFQATPVTEWTRPIKDGEKIVGWEAKVNIVNAEGRTIASAENMCMRDEPNWRDKPNYALRSMAQTRTASKAYRSVFAFVAVLAGYSATPAEEMNTSFNQASQSQGQQNPSSSGGDWTEKQKNYIWNLLKGKKHPEDKALDFIKWFGGGAETLSKSSASQLIKDFDEHYAAFIKEVPMGPREPEQDEYPPDNPETDIPF